MNLRRTYKEISTPPSSKIKFYNILEWIKLKYFWHKAHKRHKAHAKAYAIFEESGKYYPAQINSYYSWEFMDRNTYRYTWLEAQRRKFCAHNTRYSALRTIAKNHAPNITRN